MKELHISSYLSLTVGKMNFKNLYSKENQEYQSERYKKLLSNFSGKFREEPVLVFSSPGRTEISGNHTDHNHGIVLAASIDLDSIAAVLPSDNLVEISSEGYDQLFSVDLNNLNIIDNEAGTTSALIRGVASGFVNKGFKAGGFKACIMSDVLRGSGLSSSASVEVLIGTIFNYLYNSGKISPVEIAKIGQYAENKFFKKPCGLMDQITCAEGGILKIDFKNPSEPEIEKIDFDFPGTGYGLLVVDTGGSHADLTEDYAGIPAEMKETAKFFNKEFCRDLDASVFLKNIMQARVKISDRSILRAIHFLEENQRVAAQADALKENNFVKFLELVNESGNSSFKYLQNIYSPKNPSRQGVSLALALTDIFIRRKGKGAVRVHGGGFAGTILVFLPDELVNEYTDFISCTFNKDAVKVLSIRKNGACAVEL